MLNLTDEEIFAVKEYIGSKFEFVNALLTDNVLLSIDANIGFRELISDKEQLDSLLQLCINLYKAIIKFSLNNSNAISKVYRGISNTQFESLQKDNQLNKFLSTSTSLKNILDSYGNPLYDRKLLRITIENIPYLVVRDLYDQLYQENIIDSQEYHSSFGESEVILLPFTEIISIEKKELDNDTSTLFRIPIYDIMLHQKELEQLSDTEEKELYLKILSEIEKAKIAHDNYFKNKNNSNIEDLQRYVSFKKMVIKYLKSRFASIDFEYNYNRRNGIVIQNEGHNLNK